MLLKDLQNAIKTSVDDVRRAANTVRNYPAETAVQIAARVEETLVRCEKAGEQAQKNFEKTQRIITTYNSWIFQDSAVSAAYWERSFPAS